LSELLEPGLSLLIRDSRTVGWCVKREGELLDHGADEKRSERGKAGWRLNIYGWTGGDVISQLSLCCGVLISWEEQEEKNRTCPAVAMVVALEEGGEGPREAEL